MTTRLLGTLLTAAVALCGQEPAFTNSIGMQFVLIQPGNMAVGVFKPACPDPNRPEPPAPAGRGRGRGRGPADPRAAWTPADLARCKELAAKDTMPGFTVQIAKPYYIGKYEVTQAEWKKVMGTNPSIFQGDKVSDDSARHPVDNVSWQDAQAFVKKLNALEKTKAYRLPTEFEWEYAGRAGGPGSVLWADIRKQAWEQQGSTDKPSTHTVGTKEPNAWGLYDMLGNCWEWVQDYYNEKIFPDPVPPKSGTEHVLKGGGFLSDVKNTVYATHAAGPADAYDVSFRIVRDVTRGK